MWVFEEPRTEVAVLAPGDLEEFLRPGDLDGTRDGTLWSGDFEGTLGPALHAYGWDLLRGIGDDLGLCTGEIDGTGVEVL